MPTGRLRVSTLNVHGPGNPDRDRHHRLIAAAIGQLDPDVIALQEVHIDDDVLLDGLVGEESTHSHLSWADAAGIAARWPRVGRTR